MTAPSCPLVDLAELTAIELYIRRRMHEYAQGEHASVFRGKGSNFVGLRDWQAGDRLSSVDWPQSTLSNFSPMVVREYEHAGTAPIVVVADRSASTLCGTAGIPIGAGIARAIATIGLSAAYTQDLFGLITFSSTTDMIEAVRPRVGRNHVIHCLDSYQRLAPLERVRCVATLAATIAGQLRRPSLVPVVSDFLFADAPSLLRDLAGLCPVHDVFLVMVESAFALNLTDVSSGWVTVWDVESGQSQLVSRREWRALADRVHSWQKQVEAEARHLDLDVVMVGTDLLASLPALLEFVMSRKLRKE